MKYLEASALIFVISLLRYFVVAGIPFLLCYKILAKRLVAYRIQGRYPQFKDFVHDIFHSIQGVGVMTLIAVLILYSPFRSFTLVYQDISRFGAGYLFLSAVSALVIHDTYFYWMHRMLHHPKLFRHTHLTHHRSVNPSPWSSYSFHFLEAALEGAVLIVLVMVMPMHRLAILLFVCSGFLINVYGHLGYEIMPKWFRRSFLFGVINTSTHHNLHHSKFKGNYGLYFRFWDRMMGTENPNYVKEYDRMQHQRFGEGA